MQERNEGVLKNLYEVLSDYFVC